MSHKATVTMKISDLDTLKSALDSMGIKYEVAKTDNGLKIHSGYGVKADVHIQLLEDSHGHNMKAVGFEKKANGTFEAVGDFYEISGARTKSGESLNHDAFKATMSKRYCYFKAMNELSRMGFSMESDITDFKQKELAFTMVAGY